MRKPLRLIVTLLMLISLTLPAGAEDYPMRLEELGISLTIPEGLLIMTRNGPVGDAELPYGAGPEDLAHAMEEKNIYVLATDPAGSFELQVIATEVPFSDIPAQGDSFLDTFAQILKEDLTDRGAQIEDLQIYRSSSATFISLRHYIPDLNQYTQQYFTIRNGMGINITLYSYDDPVTEEEAQIVRAVADSYREDGLPPLKVPEEPSTPSFLYTEPESGATILVPRGWIREDLSKEREYVDAKFYYDLDQSRVVVFSAIDLMKEASFLQKLLYSRSDLAGSLSETDVAEIFEVDPAQVSSLRLNEQKWFRVSGDITTEAFGQDVTVRMVLLIRYGDGWQYCFQYLGDMTDRAYEDVEVMAKSLSVPERTPTSDVSLETMAYAFLIFSVIFVALILLLRWRKSQRNKKCPRCGQTRDGSANFCYNCGLKLR